MPIQPATEATKRTVSDILSRFMVEHDHHQGPHAELLAQLYCKYQVGKVSSGELKNAVVDPAEVMLRDQNRFMHLELIPKEKILPLVTIYSDSQWRRFRIYALLSSADDPQGLQTLAVRFETDEGGPSGTENPGVHDFCHAQLCNYINNHVKGVTPVWLPESQPSIPLDADSQITLALCMLTSLYGRSYVRSKFQPAEKDLLEHLEHVRALQSPALTRRR